MVATPQCSNCLYSFIAPASSDTTNNPRTSTFAGKRFCNRQAPNPPNVSPSGWLWPLVADDWWCGEGADSATKASYSTGVTGIPGSPLTKGFFTCTAAATTAVSNSLIDATDTVLVVPTNAAAATLVQAHGFYIVVVDGAFSFHVGDGTSAAGTETFSYVVT